MSQPITSQAAPPAVEGESHDALLRRYDRLVTESPQGSIYCRPWWLDAVAPGQWRLLTVRRRAQLQAAWPIVTRPRRRGEDVVMPPMTQKLGILFPPAPPERKYAEHLSREHQLIEQLINQLPRGGSFQHSFHENFTNHLPFIWHDYQQTSRVTYLLPDLRDLDAVWEDFRTKPRTLVRSCRRRGIEVDDDIDFEQMLRLNDLTFHRQGLTPPVPHHVLRRLDAACVRHDARKLLAARDGLGRVHAAIYLVFDNRVAYYLMLGSDPALRGSNAGTLLMWEAIRYAATVADVLDFEGSMIRGVECVLRDFGGRQAPYSMMTHPGPPRLPARAVRKLRTVGRSMKTSLGTIHHPVTGTDSE